VWRDEDVIHDVRRDPPISLSGPLINQPIDQEIPMILREVAVRMLFDKIEQLEEGAASTMKGGT
jgi:hypothetical protein